MDKKERKQVEVTAEVARNIIRGYKGSQIFTVTFVKRSDGSLRTMNCRKGVKKHLKGGHRNYDATKKNLVPVYDVKSEGYRMVTLDDIKSFKMRGRDYSVI